MLCPTLRWAALSSQLLGQWPASGAGRRLSGICEWAPHSWLCYAYISKVWPAVEGQISIPRSGVLARHLCNVMEAATSCLRCTTGFPSDPQVGAYWLAAVACSVSDSKAGPEMRDGQW